MESTLSGGSRGKWFRSWWSADYLQRGLYLAGVSGFLRKQYRSPWLQPSDNEACPRGGAKVDFNVVAPRDMRSYKVDFGLLALAPDRLLQTCGGPRPATNGEIGRY